MSGPLVLSYKTNVTLAAYRVVGPVTGTANTVAYPATTSQFPIGITVDDVKETSTCCPIQVNGKAKLYFNDTVTSGMLVGFDTSGRGVPFTPGVTTTSLTLATGVIGILCDATVAATGTIAEVLIHASLLR